MKILLVEDDPAVGSTLQTHLQNESYFVHWTTWGEQGVSYACEHHPHLILLDLRLPDGSGIDFCRQMRQKGLHQPIIVLTVQSDEIYKVLGLEMGADDYVTKPFSLQELCSRIRAQLRRVYGEYASMQGERIFAQHLVIDLVHGQVLREDQPVSLTPTEYRMLVYLARHAGQALTRAQIVEEVWGYNADLDSEHTVNVHIRHLREKLERDPANPALILTVPGIGYRLGKESPEIKKS